MLVEMNKTGRLDMIQKLSTIPIQDWCWTVSTLYVLLLVPIEVHSHFVLCCSADLCLVYDIESVNNYCCTRTDYFYSNGENECLSTKLAKLSCPFYSRFDSRREAADAVAEFLGGAYPNSNNEPFYSGFTGAWVKATSLGWDNLLPLFDSCESQGVLFSWLLFFCSLLWVQGHYNIRIFQISVHGQIKLYTSQQRLRHNRHGCHFGVLGKVPTSKS